MKSEEKILSRLSAAGGEYVSGEAIANELSVSRSAVGKIVRRLKEDGVPISAITNKGYMLDASYDYLCAADISQRLVNNAKQMKISVLKSVSSTNDAVRELAHNEPEGLCVIAETQTAGRGRGEHLFFSPPDTGLYMSILLKPKLSARESLLITTAAAVAVAESIEAVSGIRTSIKWVNDVFVEGRKVCGILTEAAVSVESAMLDYAVLGIGVNVFMPTNSFPVEISDIAAPLFLKRSSGIRATLAAEILNRFMAYYSNLSEKSFFESYKKHLMCIGRKIRILGQAGVQEALCIGLDEDFGLLVRYENGEEQKLVGGEISIGSNI